MALLEIIEGDDVTEMLGIQKWEKPVPGSLSGTVKGNFPSFIRKTDQERIQNLKKEFAQWVAEGVTWEVTEKLDGSSMTVYSRAVDDKIEFGVCSRNFDLAGPESEFYRENSFWQVAQRLDLETKLKSFTDFNCAIQGELVGPGVQGNKYGLTELDFYVFDIWDIDEQEYVSPTDREEIVKALGLKMAPVVGTDVLFVATDTLMNDIILFADGKSAIGNKSAREGLVFKSSCGRYSFKTVSNAWLLKTGE